MGESGHGLMRPYGQLGEEVYQIQTRHPPRYNKHVADVFARTNFVEQYYRMHLPGIQQVDSHQQIEHTTSEKQSLPVTSAASSACFCCVALRVLIIALLLPSTRKYVVSPTDKRPSHNGCQKMGDQ